MAKMSIFDKITIKVDIRKLIKLGIKFFKWRRQRIVNNNKDVQEETNDSSAPVHG